MCGNESEGKFSSLVSSLALIPVFSFHPLSNVWSTLGCLPPPLSPCSPSWGHPVLLALTGLPGSEALLLSQPFHSSLPVSEYFQPLSLSSNLLVPSSYNDLASYSTENMEPICKQHSLVPLLPKPAGPHLVASGVYALDPLQQPPPPGSPHFSLSCQVISTPSMCSIKRKGYRSSMSYQMSLRHFKLSLPHAQSSPRLNLLPSFLNILLMFFSL